MMDCEIDDIQLLPNWKLSRCFPVDLERPTFSFSSVLKPDECNFFLISVDIRVSLYVLN